MADSIKHFSSQSQARPGHDLLRNKAHCAAVLEYFLGLPPDLPKERLPSTLQLILDGRFGIRPVNRINDLLHGKHDGRRYDFERISCGRGVYRWRLHYPARLGYPKPKQQTVMALSPKPIAAPKPADGQESEFMRRRRDEERRELEQSAPLFAGWVRQ